MLGVVGYLQDETVIEVPFKVKGCLKHYFYIDPTIPFNFATVLSFKYKDKDGIVKDSKKGFVIFMPLYVNRIISIDIKDAFQVRGIADFLETEIPKIKKTVYTWLLCWNRMKWEGINRDMAKLIGKYVLFHKYGKGSL
jgi:hypothetical protein